MEMSLFKLTERYVGVKELSEQGKDHPLIQWWLSLCGFGLHSPDETPWCSAMMNGMAWELRLPRSKSAAARSWLEVGTPKELQDGIPCMNDIIVIRRGTVHGPEVTRGAPGHVGVFAGVEGDKLLILAGNQGNQVCIARFPVVDFLGIRRLA